LLYGSIADVVIVESIEAVAALVVVFRSLNNGFSDDVDDDDEVVNRDGEMVIGAGSVGVITSIRLIDATAMSVDRSHLSPRYPAGHSHENCPSSFGNDVHLPPFMQTLAFVSQ